MSNRIVITSGKGGVGKTTVTAGLGLALAAKGLSTLLIDGDVGLNNLDVVMGMENRVAYDMADVLAGKCRIGQALIQESGMPLYIMPSAHAMYSDQIKAGEFRSLIMRLDHDFDYILIDCPAGIEGGFHRSVSACEYAIVVTTPHVSAVRDADKVLSLIGSYDIKGVSVVVNRVRGDLLARGEVMTPSDISSVLRYPLMGVVPEDDAITVYSQLGRLAFSDGESGKSFGMIASALVSGSRKLYDPTDRYNGVIGYLKSRIRRNA